MAMDFDPLEREKNAIVICHFRKHNGKPWIDVVQEDPDYVEWLLSPEGPKYIKPELVQYLETLLEDFTSGFGDDYTDDDLPF